MKWYLSDSNKPYFSVKSPLDNVMLTLNSSVVTTPLLFELLKKYANGS